VKQVLVVDDSHVIRSLVEVVLKQIQLDVTTVSTGFEACRILEYDTPDMLILDVGLSDMSAWDILERVRSHPGLDQTAVIMLTARSDAGDIDRAADNGADQYLPKPFRPDELRRLVVDTIHDSARTPAS
jgi:DNA-binding response OmpR family regulator